jgi:hypothetical protein
VVALGGDCDTIMQLGDFTVFGQYFTFRLHPEDYDADMEADLTEKTGINWGFLSLRAGFTGGDDLIEAGAQAKFGDIGCKLVGAPDHGTSVANTTTNKVTLRFSLTDRFEVNNIYRMNTMRIGGTEMYFLPGAEWCDKYGVHRKNGCLKILPTDNNRNWPAHLICSCPENRGGGSATGGASGKKLARDSFAERAAKRAKQADPFAPSRPASRHEARE